MPSASCTLPNTHSHSSDVWIRTEQNHTEVLARCWTLKVNELVLERWAAFFTLSTGFLKCLHAFFASHRLFLKPRLVKFECVWEHRSFQLPASLYFNPVPCCISGPPLLSFLPAWGCRQTRRECVPSDELTAVSLLQTQFGVLMQYRSAKTWIGPGGFWCLPRLISPPQAMQCKANRREACPEWVTVP